MVNPVQKFIDEIDEAEDFFDQRIYYHPSWSRALKLGYRQAAYKEAKELTELKNE